jgi:hypothetical protein
LRRRAAWAGLAAAVALGLVAIGRVEGHRQQQQTVRGIERVRAAIGPSLTHPGPTDYVATGDETCLLWASGGRSYALELCMNWQGEVIEADDRRGVTLEVYRLVGHPGAAPFRIDPQLTSSLVTKLSRGAERKSSQRRASAS